jgi:hypothetical protein
VLAQQSAVDTFALNTRSSRTPRTPPVWSLTQIRSNPGIPTSPAVENRAMRAHPSSLRYAVDPEPIDVGLARRLSL